MTDKEKKNDEKTEEEVLLTFLTRVKDDQYAPVEKSSLKYARLSDLDDPHDLTEEEHYEYGVS